MERVAFLLEVLMQRYPEIACALENSEFPSSEKRARPASSGSSLGPSSLDGAEFWLVDGVQADLSWQEWLLKNFRHRLVLLFESLSVFKEWIYSSLGAELIRQKGVSLICLGEHVEKNEHLLRSHVWTNPGFEVGYFDPENKFKSSFDFFRYFVWHRLAVIDEMMHFGSWNWPHILRRLNGSAEVKRFSNHPDWASIPVCLVGAGFSVQEERANLSSLKQKALVISAGTAINVLEALGQTPHIAMSIDPFRAQYARFGQIAATETPLFAGWRSHYQAVDSMKGPSCLIPGTALYPISSLWEGILGYEEYPLDGSPNVVTQAMSLAKHLGASEIFLLGVDLSIQHNSLYAAGVAANESFFEPPCYNEEEKIKVGSGDGECITYVRWLGEAEWIDRFAQKEGPVFRNKTAHLPLLGTESLEMSVWLEKLVPKDYEGWIWSWLQGLEATDPEVGHSLFESFAEEITKTAVWLKEESEKLQLLLEPHQITLEKAPDAQIAFENLPAKEEALFEIFLSDLENREFYNTLFCFWLTCFDRIYTPSFASLREESEGFLWLDGWMTIKRIDFLLQGISQMQQWIEEVRQDQFFSEVDRV